VKPLYTNRVWFLFLDEALEEATRSVQARDVFGAF
jgi:hypothetical protein